MTINAKAMVTGLVILVTGYTVLPIGWLLIASTKDLGGLGSTASLAPGSWSQFAGNVTGLLGREDGNYPHWFVNSLLYAGGGAAIGTLVSGMAGYGFAKLQFRGRRAAFGLVLSGVLVPTTALAVPLYLLASETGLVNTVWAVLIPAATNPFGVFLARVFADSGVPDEILEAARLDGAGEVRIFFAVARSLMGPGLATVFLFQFVAIWNNFLLPLVMLTEPRLFPVSLGLYSWNSRVGQFPEYTPLIITGSLLAIVPLLVAFVVLRRYWRSGLAAGSVTA